MSKEHEDKDWKTFEVVIKNFQSGFSHMTEEEIQRMVDEELEIVRKEPR